MTTPLPPTKDDPSVVRGRALQAEYLSKLGALRSDHLITDLVRARQIDAVWRSTCKELGAAYEDLQARRQARLVDLESQVPTGPGIEDDATAADEAVLMSAFRAALGQARNASNEELTRLLEDAVRFGDDILKRAIITVVTEEGRGMSVLKAEVLALTPGTQAALEEIGQLREDLAGRHNGWVWQSLSAPRQPEESTRLPDLEAMHVAREQGLQASRSTNFGP